MEMSELVSYPAVSSVLSAVDISLYRDKLELMVTEVSALSQWITGIEGWEEHLHNGGEDDWSVFPICYQISTATPTRWIPCEKILPTTCEFARTLGATTSLLSRMGPRTVLRPHRGYGSLSNTSYRIHFPLVLPAKPDTSGLWVRGEKRFHKAGQPLVFDDSLKHSGFNTSDNSRIVLVIDVPRPDSIPRGDAPEENGVNEVRMQGYRLLLEALRTC